MRDPNNPCLFCNTSTKEFIFENDLAFVTFDSYPVSKYHSLIIPKRHIKDYFDLTNDELASCHDLLLKMKNKINSEYNSVKGFNIGSNSEKSEEKRCVGKCNLFQAGSSWSNAHLKSHAIGK